MSDIREYGRSEGVGFYWLQSGDGFGSGNLQLAAIDERGNVEYLPIRTTFDPDAPTRSEAVQEHLAGAISQADQALERRRAERPEQEPPPTHPDEATRRFFTE